MGYAGHYSTDTFDMREGAFRFGGLISLDNLRQEYYRDIFAHFLCRGLIEESIGKGFEVVDDNGEELDWNDDLQDILEEYLPEMVRALAMERRDGKSLITFMKKGSKLIFRSFTRKYYKVDYDDLGLVKSVEARSEIENHPSYITHNFADKKLESIRELVFRRREKVGEGMSYLEPIWDYLIAMYFLISHSAYAIARAGAGVKKAKQVMDDSTPIDPIDDDTITDLMQNLAQWGSANDVLWVPAGVEIDLAGDMGKIPIGELFDIYLACISAYSGVPKSRLVGLVPGQLEGAEVNEQSYFDVLRDIQEQVKPIIRWFVLKIIEFHGFGSEEFDIRFNVREEMSESDEITLDMKKLDLAMKYIDLGVKKERAMELAGLDLKASDLEDEQEDEEEADEVEQVQEAVINGQ